MKIAQDTQFKSDVLSGANGKKFALLNKREEVMEDGATQYVADGYDISGVDDVRKFLYQQVSDPLFFKVQRGEIEQSEWLDAIAQIKSLEL